MSSTGAFEGLDGIQSGIASKKIIDALVATRQERVDKLANKKVDLESRVSVYGKIQNLVTELKGVATSLSMSTSLGKLAAISSSPNKIEGVVTGTGNAQPGIYDIEVKSVASSSRYYSDTFNSATQTGLLGDINLDIQVGADNSRGQVIQITQDMSLEDVKNAINSAALGVNAQITESTTNGVKGFALVLNGMKTGEANNVIVNEMPYAAGNPVGGGMLNFGDHEARSAKDTVISVDGMPNEYRSSSDLVEGAIPQVSIKVSRGAAEAGKVELRLETNPESVKAQLEQFVEAYNRLMRMLYETTKKPPAEKDQKNALLQQLQTQDDADDWFVFNDDGTQSPSDKKIVVPDRYKLSGDKTISRLSEELQRMLVMPLEGINSGVKAASHVGVVGARDSAGNLRRDGTITIDDEKFKNAVLSDYDGLLKVFTSDPIRGTSGVFGKIQKVLEDFSFSPTGQSGALDASEASMKYDIRRMREEIESKQESVDSYRRVLSAQFVSLETFMAKHKAQGDYLNSIASAVTKR